MAFNWDNALGFGDLLGGIGGAIGGFIGDRAGEDERRRAMANLNAIRGLYEGINPYVQAGVEETYNLGPSAMEGVASQVDPTMRSTQLAALRSLMETAGQGGFDAQSQAALMQAQGQAAQQQRAQQGALRQDFAARGRAGGGTELALRAAGQQQSANANAMAGVQAAADARARALAALQSGASLAGQVRGTDYAQAADVAGARDRIAEYNSRNSQAVAGRNIDRRYQADQQTYNNRLGRADRQAGAMRDQSSYLMDQERRRREMGQGLGSAVGRGAGAVGGGYFG